ncbi:MAG: tetratricopeptide repeat protein [Candidatus Nitronauta litoralis]|uniref:Tetratricopeptide repeat protein n=1 Tax=Candidatus Nitronauta litoralis TaxID=2705533 RepID=A0A7T0BYA6_9BACT|nr:MAG: tetratricopeptide repeat protein [Candidatus Nitronauta litoralis]
MISIRNTTRWALVAIGLLSFVWSNAYGSPFGSEAQDGIDLYNQEDYAKALKSFEAARLTDPENGNVLYNLANTHYKLGNFDHALKALEEAESVLDDPAMKQKTHYNRGNAYYRMGDVERAIESYKKALELDPSDTDAKFNLEYARKQYERAKQANRMAPRGNDKTEKDNENGMNPAHQQDPNESKEQTNETGEPPDSNPPEDEKDSQKAEVDKPQDSGGGKLNEEPHSPPAGEPSDEEQKMAKAMQEITSMNKDEADRWLNSLDEDLKKMSRRQVQGQMKDLFVEGGKDW